MNRSITVFDRQTMFDVAIQHCGDQVAVFEIAALNNIAITDRLVTGQALIVPAPYNTAITNYYQKNGLVPATEEV